jgi:hypothetical protein
MVSPARPCIYCKGGKALCGHSPCPLFARFKLFPKSNEISGSATSIFVGRFGYPNVWVGPLVGLDDNDKNILDNPSLWFGLEYQKIIEIRSALLRSKVKQTVHSRSTFVEKNQELAAAKHPPEVELLLKHRPTASLSFSTIVQPMGPSAEIEKLKIVENVNIARSVETVLNDDLKAAEAVGLLFQKGVDVYKITTILSSGALGLPQHRKLVPTRWSITALDDILAKQLMREIREFPQLENYHVGWAEHLDNRFVILLLPGSWEYEGFEAWAPGSSWSFNLKKTEIIEEYEPFGGRKNYADKQGGGYYAARFAVVEALHQMRRQAKAVVFREVYEGYVIPLGVWVVRETARRAMANMKRFDSFGHALEFVRSKLRIPLSEYAKQSRLLQQRRLQDYL